MAIKHNQIGSLSELLKKLRDAGVNNFHSLDEIRLFRSDFKSSPDIIRQKNKALLLQKITDLEVEYQKQFKELGYEINEREKLLRNEKDEISARILSPEKPVNFIMRVINLWRKRTLQKRKAVLELNFEEEVRKPLYNHIYKVDILKRELENLKADGERLSDLLSEKEINRDRFILSILDSNSQIFYGAEGEEKALNQLEKLPDSYIIINDYKREFYKPIYDKRNDDRIHSIQVDHIIVGPTGVYIIETKNWSQKSINSSDLFSPVKQLRRSSFAMFVLLNQAVQDREIEFFNKNWGEQKISLKSIVLLMNHLPVEEFQYVKILSLADVNSFICGGPIIYSKEEIEALVSYLNQTQCWV
jgi:hypothetical protein